MQPPQAVQGIVGQHWDFGDGNTLDVGASLAVVPHTYNVPAGTYYITLTVTNAIGLTGKATNSVSVWPAPTFTASALTVATNVVVYLTNNAAGSYDTVLWTFGDGNTSSSLNHVVSHYYDTTNIYPVQLTVSDSTTTLSGQSAVQNITVTTGVVAQIQGKPGFQSVKVSGGYVTLVITNVPASAGRLFNVLSTTNVAAAKSTWPTNITGTFSANGGFTNPVSSIPATSTRTFFLIQVP